MMSEIQYMKLSQICHIYLMTFFYKKTNLLQGRHSPMAQALLSGLNSLIGQMLPQARNHHFKTLVYLFVFGTK